jgi:hypothetical protein
MSKFAQMMYAPGNWKDLHNPLVGDGSAVRIALMISGLCQMMRRKAVLAKNFQDSSL